MREERTFILQSEEDKVLKNIKFFSWLAGLLASFRCTNAKDTRKHLPAFSDLTRLLGGNLRQFFRLLTSPVVIVTWSPPEGQTVGRWCVSRRKRFFVQKNIHKVKQPHRNCVLYCRLQLVATLETHVGDMEWKKIEPDWIIVSHNCAIKPQVFFISILL